MSQEPVNPNDVFIVADLETTGLNPETASIIQIAAVAVNRNWMEISRFDSLVKPFPKDLEKMNEYVENMHTQNGLLERLRTENPPCVEQVGNKFADWIQSVKNEDGQAYLMGNSIHGVDVPFTKVYMPQIYSNYQDEETGKHGPLHYRALDVTGFRLSLGLATGINWIHDKARSHTAMEDCLECIGEFKFLNEMMCHYYSK